MLQIHSFTFSPVQENTYVVYDEQTHEAAIIDPGCMRHSEEEQLRSFIDAHQLKPTLLLCTHQHFDHVWGVPFVLETWPDLPAYGHQRDFELLPPASEQLKKFGLTLPATDIPVSRYTLVDQDDLIPFAGESIRVLFVPGHAPGHIAFYFPQSGFLLAGDTLLRGTIGRTDFWYGDFGQLVQGIKTQYMSLPDETIVYSGHGPETTIGEERRTNEFLR